MKLKVILSLLHLFDLLRECTPQITASVRLAFYDNANNQKMRLCASGVEFFILDFSIYALDSFARGQEYKTTLDNEWWHRQTNK